MATSNLDSLCGLPVSGLYLYDPSSLKDPVNFVLCPELSSACDDGSMSCNCRNSTVATIGGSAVQIPVCSTKCSGPGTIDCSNSGDSSNSNLAAPESSNSSMSETPAIPANSTTEDSATMASSDGVVHAPTVSSASSDAEQSSATATTASSMYDGQTSPSSTVPAVGSPSSASTNPTNSSVAVGSSNSMSTTIMVVIIVICVVFIALVALFVWRYCAAKSAEKNNESRRRTNFHAIPPTHSPGESFATPTMLSRHDRRTRSLSPRNGVYHEQTGTLEENAVRDRGNAGLYPEAQEAWGHAGPRRAAKMHDRADVVLGYYHEDLCTAPIHYNQATSGGVVYEHLNIHDRVSRGTRRHHYECDENTMTTNSPAAETTRSIAPSIASTATTVLVPGRQVMQKRRPYAANRHTYRSGSSNGSNLASATTSDASWFSVSDNQHSPYGSRSNGAPETPF